MAVGPTSNQIQDLVTLTGISAKESERWLQAYECSTDKAANAYFDDGGVLKPQNFSHNWDEDAFHSERASGGGQHPPAFAVHAQDTLNPQVFRDNTPSRPPSRVSTKGSRGLGGHEARSNMSLAEREDYEIQQAMSQSMTENQFARPMTGASMENNTHFGPATREHYDTQSWTMTLPRTFAQEIIENPVPLYRKRGPDNPSFFKPSLSGNRLPALIKILQSIPMGREALLNRALALPDYGRDEDWWDGVPIDLKRLKVINGPEISIGSDSEELIHETQRLIAFLEETDRAYGSTEVLAQMPFLKGRAADQVVGGFLEAWTTATAESQQPFAKVFQSATISASSDDQEGEPHYHQIFNINVADMGSETGRNLYDILDEQFWGDYLRNKTTYHCLHEVGDILCIQLNHRMEDTSACGIKVPAVLHLDRYFLYSKKLVQDMLAAKQTVTEEIKTMDDVRDNIINHRPDSGEQTFNGPKMIADGLAHFRSVPTESMIHRSMEIEQVIGELQILANSISVKLAALQRSRNEAVEKSRELSKHFTSTPAASGVPSRYEYTLRGVSISSDTFYVFDKRPSSEPVEWQWWKITYLRGHAQPVLRTRVREIEVLNAAKDDSKATLLVYASQEALAVDLTELPSPLRNFVRVDNLSFAAELEKHEPLKPTTPTKRKVGDRYDSGDGCYHSSDDGLEAVDIPLDHMSEERVPLLDK